MLSQQPRPYNSRRRVLTLAVARPSNGPKKLENRLGVNLNLTMEFRCTIIHRKDPKYLSRVIRAATIRSKRFGFRARVNCRKGNPALYHACTSDLL